MASTWPAVKAAQCISEAHGHEQRRGGFGPPADGGSGTAASTAGDAAPACPAGTASVADPVPVVFTPAPNRQDGRRRWRSPIEPMFVFYAQANGAVERGRTAAQAATRRQAAPAPTVACRRRRRRCRVGLGIAAPSRAASRPFGTARRWVRPCTSRPSSIHEHRWLSMSLIMARSSGSGGNLARSGCRRTTRMGDPFSSPLPQDERSRRGTRSRHAACVVAASHGQCPRSQ